MIVSTELNENNRIGSKGAQLKLLIDKLYKETTLKLNSSERTYMNNLFDSINVSFAVTAFNYKMSQLCGDFERQHYIRKLQYLLLETLCKDPIRTNEVEILRNLELSASSTMILAMCRVGEIIKHSFGFIEGVIESFPDNLKAKMITALNVVSREMFEDALRVSRLFTAILTYTIFHPSDCRLPAWIPILKGNYIYNQEMSLSSKKTNGVETKKTN